MDTRLRILLVHNYYQIPGGEDTVVANEKKMLEDNGHYVSLYKRNNDELRKMNFFQKICMPFTAIFSFKTYREIKRIIKSEHIDIVHVHNTLTMVSPSVFYAALFCKIPVVQTLHNFRMQCPNGLFFRNGHICEECMNDGLGCAIRHKCYRNSRIQTMVSAATIKIHRIIGTYRKVNFICLTEFNKEKLLELNYVKKGSGLKKRRRKIIDEKKVFVKPNFTDVEGEKIFFEDRKKQCVFAGRLEEVKGIKLLLEAWEKIEDVKLVVCGTGPLEEWCKDFVKEKKLENVEIKGFTTHDDLIQIIKESKALLMPSLWYEGFPMTLAESLACATPIIGSNIGNVGNLIKNGKNGWKVNLSKEEIKEKVECLMRSDFNGISSPYTSKINYEILLNCYEKIGEEWKQK
ncbi:MAG: glycosyltransferase family 4 protein [Lachnospiraceae bacterium]|nr:glycosyltransferase family 4 protein [Lachnospiraceae bacterium]